MSIICKGTLFFSMKAESIYRLIRRRSCRLARGNKLKRVFIQLFLISTSIYNIYDPNRGERLGLIFIASHLHRKKPIYIYTHIQVHRKTTPLTK